MKKNLFLITVIFLFLSLASDAQPIEFKWLGTGRGMAGAGCSVVKRDNAGNVYIAGDYDSPDLAFDQFKLPKTTVPRDMYVAKFNAKGKVMWAAKSGGVKAESLMGMGVDKNGNVYVCGYSYSKEVNFGGYKVESKSGARLCFLAKYDSTGKVVWAKADEGGEYNGLTIGSDNNPVVTGWFIADGSMIGNKMIPNTVSRQPKMMVAKFNGDGDVLWATRSGGEGFETGSAIASDKEGNIFITGFFSNTVQFGTEEQTQAKDGNPASDVFVVKYDKDGNCKWAVNAAGGSDTESPKNICLDKSGNIYVAGSFKSRTLKSVGVELQNNSEKSNYENYFLVKLNSEGKLSYQKQFGKPEVKGITADQDENVYVYGTFYGDSVRVGNTLMRNPKKGEDDESDFFIASLDKEGSFKWATNFGDGDTQLAYSVTNDDTGNIYIAGGVRAGKNPFGALRIELPLGKGAVFVAKIKVKK